MKMKQISHMRLCQLFVSVYNIINLENIDVNMFIMLCLTGIMKTADSVNLFYLYIQKYFPVQ